MHPGLQRGFTILELAIVMVLAGILLAAGMPAMRDWITNQRIRTSTESILNGLQLARGEAVRQNTLVDLRIGADGFSWDVFLNGSNTPLQTHVADGSTSVCVMSAGACTAAAATTITFNGTGRMISPAAFAQKYGATLTDTRTRPMCVAVMSNTPRMCDPQRTDPTDPQSCYVSGALITGC